MRKMVILAHDYSALHHLSHSNRRPLLFATPFAIYFLRSLVANTPSKYHAPPLSLIPFHPRVASHFVVGVGFPSLDQGLRGAYHFPAPAPSHRPILTVCHERGKSTPSSFPTKMYSAGS